MTRVLQRFAQCGDGNPPGGALAIAAMLRREKWVAVAVLGILVSVFLVLVSSPLVWTALQ